MSRLSDVPITLSEALDPSSVGAKLKSLTGWANSVIGGDQQEAVQAYLILCRSKEEISMLQEDALNVVNYYERVKKVVCSKLASLSAVSDLYSRGSISLLHLLLANISNLLEQGRLTLRTITTPTSSSREPCMDGINDDEDSSDCVSEDEEF